MENGFHVCMVCRMFWFTAGTKEGNVIRKLKRGGTCYSQAMSHVTIEICVPILNFAL